MDLEESVVFFALQDEAISSAFGKRIYVDKVPDKPGYPWAKLSQVASADRHSQAGFSGRVITLQLETFHSNKLECNAFAELFKDRFGSYKGMIGDIKTGRCWLKDVSGNWMPDGRHFRRLQELEVATNDR